MTVVEERTYVEEARREKLRALTDRGIAPFAYRFDRSHDAAGALAAFDENKEVSVRVAGRLVALRPHGKTTFAHLADRSGKIQLYLNINRLGADSYEATRLLDLGDFVGVEGPLKMTRTGEITVWVDRYELLAKALRPLPFGKEDADGKVHSGLTDASKSAATTARQSPSLSAPETSERSRNPPSFVPRKTLLRSKPLKERPSWKIIAMWVCW